MFIIAEHVFAVIGLLATLIVVLAGVREITARS